MRSLREVISALPAERRLRIEARSLQLYFRELHGQKEKSRLLRRFDIVKNSPEQLKIFVEELVKGSKFGN